MTKQARLQVAQHASDCTKLFASFWSGGHLQYQCSETTCQITLLPARTWHNVQVFFQNKLYKIGKNNREKQGSCCSTFLHGKSCQHCKCPLSSERVVISAEHICLLYCPTTGSIFHEVHFEISFCAFLHPWINLTLQVGRSLRQKLAGQEAMALWGRKSVCDLDFPLERQLVLAGSTSCTSKNMLCSEWIA